MKIASKVFDHCFKENWTRGCSHYFVKLRKMHFNKVILFFRPFDLLLVGFYHSLSLYFWAEVTVDLAMLKHIMYIGLKHKQST